MSNFTISALIIAVALITGFGICEVIHTRKMADYDCTEPGIINGRADCMVYTRINNKSE